MEFQLQNVYLIYTWLIIIFYILCDYVTMTCDRCVTVCDVILNPNPKSKIKRNEKGNKINKKMKMKKNKSTAFNSDIASAFRAWESRLYNTNRLQKTIKYYKRVREYWK